MRLHTAGQEVWVWPRLAEWGAGPRRPRGAGKGPGLQEGWVASEGPLPPWAYPAGQREGRGLRSRKAGRAGGSSPSSPSGRAWEVPEGNELMMSEPLSTRRLLPTHHHLEPRPPCPPPPGLSSWSFRHRWPYPSRVSQEPRRWSSVHPHVSHGQSPCLPLSQRGRGPGRGRRAATCASELTQATRLLWADGPDPAAPALGPGRGQQLSTPSWPKYNLSRRLAGNRDLCQLPAGAGGRKVSVIGRGAGQAGSQTWVM